MEDEPRPEPSVQERTLYAIRALGIFFIRSAVASLVGGTIVGVGVVILMFGGLQSSVLGGVVIGIGALVTIIWEIAIVVGANRELRKAGGVAGGLDEWLGLGSR